MIEQTLYIQAKEIEDIERRQIELYQSFKLNIPKLQRSLFKKYERNPILKEAIQERQTIKESLEELSQVNKGIKKFLPRKKNRFHNNRLEKIGELVSYPSQLYTRGVFIPDNIVTATFEMGTSLFLLTDSLIPNSPQNLSLIISTIGGLYYGMMMNFMRLHNKTLPNQEAEYIDEKIRKFYR